MVVRLPELATITHRRVRVSIGVDLLRLPPLPASAAVPHHRRRLQLRRPGLPGCGGGGLRGGVEDQDQ